MIAQHGDIAEYGWGRNTENPIAKWNVSISVCRNKANRARLVKSENAVVVQMGGIMGGGCLGAIIQMGARSTEILGEIWSKRDRIVREKIAKMTINRSSGLSVQGAEVLVNGSGRR
jgi:hypothetical protein